MKLVKKLFKKRWSKWTDMSSGSVDENKYLLQSRRHRNGKVKFRVAKSQKAWGCTAPTLEQLSKTDETQ